MKLITEIWRKEFSLRSLTMKHDKFSDFYTSQWQTDGDIRVAYVAYRAAVALVFAVTLVLSVLDLNHPDETAENRAKWLIYLTHWGYAVCAVQAFLACYMVLHMYRKVRKRTGLIPEPQINPKLCAVYWVLYTIATDSAFGITCIYWSLIYNAKEHPLDVMNIFVHGMNSVLMMADLFLVAHPVRLLHCYWPFLFAAIYIVFNIIYYMLGGTDKHGFHYVYAILDWERPGRSALTTFLALMFLVFLHLLTYCLFLLRRRIYNNVFQTNNPNISFSMAADTKNCIANQSYNDNHQSEYL